VVVGATHFNGNEKSFGTRVEGTLTTRECLKIKTKLRHISWNQHGMGLM
jgi:hypothetical protein